MTHPLTEQREQLRDAVLRLADHLDHAQVDTESVHTLLQLGALSDAAELACRAAKGRPDLHHLRLETATLAAVACFLQGRTTLRA